MTKFNAKPPRNVTLPSTFFIATSLINIYTCMHVREYIYCLFQIQHSDNR